MITAVLVSRPSIMHNTLRGMLESLSHIRVLEAAGALSAYDLLQEKSADTVVINANLVQAEKLSLLNHIQQNFSHMNSVVLTITTRNNHALYAAGAGTVLLHSCTPRELETAVYNCRPLTASNS